MVIYNLLLCHYFFELIKPWFYCKITDQAQYKKLKTQKW